MRPTSTPPSPDAESVPGSRLFGTTHWSVVLAAGDLQSPDAQSALGTLCQTYWYPLYCCVRRHGHSPEDAQDLTQAFFAKLLARNQVALAEPERGRFRTFLLRSLENFIRTAHRDQTTLKRGRGWEFISAEVGLAEERYAEEPADSGSPAAFFERQWAVTLLDHVLERVRREFCVSGRNELFEELEPHLWGDDTSLPHADIAARLQLTVVAVRVTLHRLRQRFHDLLRAEIAGTVGRAEETEDELQYLRKVLAR